MRRFVQLHVLTSYPPSNLNRDDLGRPKSAIVGGVTRLRISSQSLKRAWRTSEFIKGAFETQGLYGTRTRRVGTDWVFAKLKEAGIDDEVASKWAVDIQRAYGDPEDPADKGILNKQAVHLSNVERKALEDFVNELATHLKGGEPSERVKQVKEAIEKRDRVAGGKYDDEKLDKGNKALAKQLAEMLLATEAKAVDIAMFGRMLAASPKYNVEAAVQVSHAFTVHRATVESDYFTAVDDLKPREEDVGAGHIGETGYGAGVFYLYVCINRELLDANLGGDRDLRNRALAALLHAVTKVSPTGKQNSFASRAYASYVLAEKGDQPPRSLALAFVKPVSGPDYLGDAIEALKKRWENLDQVYGPCASAREELNAEKGDGRLEQLIAFVQAD